MSTALEQENGGWALLPLPLFDQFEDAERDFGQRDTSMPSGVDRARDDATENPFDLLLMAGSGATQYSRRSARQDLNVNRNTLDLPETIYHNTK